MELLVNFEDKDTETKSTYKKRKDNIDYAETFKQNLKCIIDNICEPRVDFVAKKSVAVYFSGGFDSTYLIIKNLEAGNEVYPIILNFNNYEWVIQQTVFYQLKKVYKEFLHKPVLIQDIYAGLEAYETCGVNQQPMCAFFAASLPSEITRKVSEIQLGYVIGDIACSFLSELKTLYTTALKFKHYTDFTPPKLTFPLSKLYHFDTINKVYEWSKNHNLILPCISCELPEITFECNKTSSSAIIEVCERCDSCHKNNSGIFISQLNENNLTKNIRISLKTAELKTNFKGRIEN